MNKNGLHWRWATAFFILALITIGAWHMAGISADNPSTQKAAEKDDVSLLFVQNAASGTLVPVKGEKDVFTLTLEGISKSTIFFSDRPKLVTGHESTDIFIRSWGVGKDSFKAFPPNAALDILDGEAEGDVFIVKISEPSYDTVANQLTYRAEILKDMVTGGLESFNEKFDTPATIPMKFDHAALFIDTGDADIPLFYFTKQCVGCDLSYANMHFYSLIGANVQGANLTGADLGGSFLTGANMQGADLTGVNLIGASLVDANLTGANLTNANMNMAGLDRAILTGAKFCNTRMPDDSVNNSGCP